MQTRKSIARAGGLVPATKVPTVVGERANPPRGWREGHDSSLACPHRDMSVCPACAVANPEAWDCLGAHFWVPVSERAKALNAEPK